MTRTFEIYWGDLTKECQDKLDKFLGLEIGNDNNYTFIPITTIEIEDELNEELSE